MCISIFSSQTSLLAGLETTPRGRNAFLQAFFFFFKLFPLTTQTILPFLRTHHTASLCPTPPLHTLFMSPRTSRAPCLTIFPSAFPRPPWGEALLTLSPRLPASSRASRAAHFMAGHTPGLRRQHRHGALAGHLPHPHATFGCRGLTCLEWVRDGKLLFHPLFSS